MIRSRGSQNGLALFIFAMLLPTTLSQLEWSYPADPLRTVQDLSQNEDMFGSALQTRTWFASGGEGKTSYLDDFTDGIIRHPSNILFAEGNLYVASFTLNHVVRFSLASRSERVRYKVFAQGLDGPSALAFDAASRSLFVASFGKDRVMHYSTETGALVATYGTEKLLDCPESLAIRDGALYVGSYLQGHVVKIVLETGEAAVWGRMPLRKEKVDTKPWKKRKKKKHKRRAFFPEESVWCGNNLLVTDFSNSRILRFNASGEYLGTFAKGKTLGGPVGLIVHHDSVLVASYKRNVVVQFSLSGKFMGLLASGGEMKGVSSLTVADDGTLLVASYEDSRILRHNGSAGTRSSGESVEHSS